MKQLIDYIKVYENVIDDDLCDRLIESFESNSDLVEMVDNNGYPTFSHLNVGSLPDSVELYELCLKSIIKCNDQYIEDLGIVEFPHKYAFEQFRIKRYLNNDQEEFKTHVDVSSHSSAKRFLGFFFYLNDVEEGGETGFPHLDYEVKPKKGSVIIFPPLWLYKHYGRIPVSGNKYILGSYLHYVDYEIGKEDSEESDLQQ
jgi:hypothetical protein